MDFTGYAYSKNKLRELYSAIVLPRMIEEKMLINLRQGKITKWFSGIGQEAIAVGVKGTFFQCTETSVYLPVETFP